MGTRSLVIYEDKKGKKEVLYSQFDGYGVGASIEKYQDELGKDIDYNVVRNTFFEREKTIRNSCIEDDRFLLPEVMNSRVKKLLNEDRFEAIMNMYWDIEFLYYWKQGNKPVLVITNWDKNNELIGTTPYYINKP